MTLFRSEALAYQQIGDAEGSILIRSPAMLWFFSTGAVLLTMGLVWLVCTSHYTQREHAVGRLVYDKPASNLIAYQSGVVRSNLVQQGAKVVAGQPLFEVSKNPVLERSLASTEQKSTPTEIWHIVAPHDGVMGDILVRTGQTIETGQTLAQLQPKSARLQAEIFVSEKAFLTIKIGDKIDLRYVNYPYQQFEKHAAIINELRSTATPQTNESGHIAKRRYRVLLDLMEESLNSQGNTIKLRADMELEADLILSEKNVMEWIFEPLKTTKGKQP